MTEVTTWYLEMQSPDRLRAKPQPAGLEVREAEIRQYRFNRYLYQLVGEQWQWTDKLGLSDEDWQSYAESDDLRTWVAYFQGSIAGYYELQQQTGGNVEICYFGLAPGFIGKGFGGYLLSHSIQSAWQWSGTRRLWVHSCSLDHPSALANYQARGLELYNTETETIDSA